MLNQWAMRNAQRSINRQGSRPLSISFALIWSKRNSLPQENLLIFTTRFRLRVCQRTGLLSSEFFPMVQESDELVKILGKIVHNALRNSATEGRRKRKTING
jgi:hypothetical protein